MMKQIKTEPPSTNEITRATITLVSISSSSSSPSGSTGSPYLTWCPVTAAVLSMRDNNSKFDALPKIKAF